MDDNAATYRAVRADSERFLGTLDGKCRGLDLLRSNNPRAESFVGKNAKGQLVNRTDGIASVGSAALDNEECYLLQKWLRSLGLMYIEHQARI